MERAIFSEKTCPIEQECILYRKCSHTKQLFDQMLSISDKNEKEKLTQEIKDLVCGSYTSEKTVCCDIFDPCEPNPCGPKMTCLSDPKTKYAKFIF